jgi:hypothetical protein
MVQLAIEVLRLQAAGRVAFVMVPGGPRLTVIGLYEPAFRGSSTSICESTPKYAMAVALAA